MNRLYAIWLGVLVLGALALVARCVQVVTQ